MSHKLPESPPSNLTRNALLLLLLGACAGRQSQPSLQPDHDVAGLDTVLVPTTANATTVSIYARFPVIEHPVHNFLVITSVAMTNNQARQMSGYEICTHPEVRCFVSTGVTDEVCVRLATFNRPSIIVRHMNSQSDYPVTSCPIRPNAVVSCEVYQGETLVCVRGQIQ